MGCLGAFGGYGEPSVGSRLDLSSREFAAETASERARMKSVPRFERYGLWRVVRCVKGVMVHAKDTGGRTEVRGQDDAMHGWVFVFV